MTFERSQFAEPDDEAGIMIDGLGAALVTWTAMQDRSPITVADAALAFNTTPEVIREAIEAACWIFIASRDDITDPTKQIIELDGA
jgi:hypothetical protein